jgi:enoyl-CoA hydratase/carnithine racemase
VPAVRFEADGAVARVILDRPEAKNALNLEAIQDLLAALRRGETEPAVRVVVLQGTGGDFSAGGDIKDMVARRGKGVETYERLKRGLTAIVRAIIHHERPVLARVDGVCMGAGAGVALACDAVLATARSTFGFPFVKVGLVPDTGTSWLLPHTVGVQNARRLLLTGEAVGAEEAAAMGMVTKVVPDAAALDAELKAWADRFTALPPTAVRDAKRLVWTNLPNTLEHSIVQEAIQQGIRFTTPEHAAAVDAFLARRGK